MEWTVRSRQKYANRFWADQMVTLACGRSHAYSGGRYASYKGGGRKTPLWATQAGGTSSAESKVQGHDTLNEVQLVSLFYS